MSKELAAFEMAKFLSEKDFKNINEKLADRKLYFFKLYQQCLQMTSGGDADVTISLGTDEKAQ